MVGFLGCQCRVDEIAFRMSEFADSRGKCGLESVTNLVNCSALLAVPFSGSCVSESVNVQDGDDESCDGDRQKPCMDDVVGAASPPPAVCVDDFTVGEVRGLSDPRTGKSFSARLLGDSLTEYRLLIGGEEDGVLREGGDTVDCQGAEVLRVQHLRDAAFRDLEN